MSITTNKNIIKRRVICLERGFTQVDLAKAAGCSMAAINVAINNANPNSRRKHEAIAAVLGVTLADFWPELYAPDVLGSKILQHNTPPSKVEKNLTETRA